MINYDYFYKRAIVIFGGAGLIGKAIVKRLDELSANVWAPSSGLIDAKQIDQYPHILEKFDTIIHCAAKSEGAQSMADDPKKLITPNVIMTANLLHQAQEQGVKNFIYLSSTTVNYPEQYEGIAHMKIFGEALCSFYRNRYGLNTTIIRPCNVYGPHDKFDERAHFIPALIKRAIDKEDPFEIWGDGTQKRNIVYSDDLAEGILEVMPKQQLGPYTIGGYEVTIGDIAEEILKIANHEPEVVYASNHPIMIHSNLPKVDIIKNSTDLISGLEKTMNYYLREKEKNGKR